MSTNNTAGDPLSVNITSTGIGYGINTTTPSQAVIWGGIGGAGGGGGSYSGLGYGYGQMNTGSADILVQGRSLKEFITKTETSLAEISARLGMVQLNPELEKEFDELRVAAERYLELEKKFLEQKAVFEVLKKD